MSAAEAFGGLFRGFAGTFGPATAEKKRRKHEKEQEDKRLAIQQAQFQQSLAAAQEQNRIGNERNAALDKFMMWKGGKEEARADVASERAGEVHDVQFGWLRDPVKRDAFVTSEMAKLRAPILQLEQLEFNTGKMADIYERGKVAEGLENSLKTQQKALNDQTLKMSQFNLGVSEKMAPIQQASAEALAGQTDAHQKRS